MDLTVAKKVRLLTGATLWRTHSEPDLGLRALVLSDGPVGVRGESWDERRTSLCMPSPTAVAATWDEDLVYRLGALMATEARRKNVDVVLAPTINLHRSPLTGRHFECFSEDPLLTGRIGAAFIRGVQSGGVAATAKHYVANDSETERMSLDARVDDRTLRELYLAPFEAAVEAGVWVVMSAYNSVNGASMTENPLLAEPLKGEWGFTGVVVSDWGAVRSVAASARSAQDLAMPGPKSLWSEALAAAVDAGEVPESELDEKIRRLVLLAERTSNPAPSLADDRALLREAVSASTVLLRNENSLLPLDKSTVGKVAVIGPNASAVHFQGGGSAGVYPSAVVSYVDALAEVAEVAYAPGVYTTERPTPVGLHNISEPGLLVRALDADGNELAAEHRSIGHLIEPTWVPGTKTVEIHAVLRPSVTGAWRVAVAGWGRISLAVEGISVIDEVVEVTTEDPATVHLAPPYREARIALEAGQEVHLVARRELGSGTGRACSLAADAPHDENAFATAVDLARSSDLAVVVVGTTDESESEGVDRSTLALPGKQDELVRAVCAANPNTVVVVNSGSPVLLPWRDEVPAILLNWLPGQEAGGGLADVLFGVMEPGGRLPTTWPAEDAPVSVITPADGVLDYTEGLDIGHRAWLVSPSAPAYWFGHGLGYTTWLYEAISVEGNRVHVRVRNTGDRAGREVVQVYLAKPDSSIERPVRWLAGFAAATAAPGETVDVTVDIPPRAFQHWAHGWQTETGPFEAHAGPSAATLPLTATLTPSLG